MSRWVRTELLGRKAVVSFLQTSDFPRRFAATDPALESLTAGQKILVRAGPVNARRLKAKLAQFRGQVAKGAARR